MLGSNVYNDVSRVMAMSTKKTEGRLMLPLLPHFNFFRLLTTANVNDYSSIMLYLEPSRNEAKKKNCQYDDDHHPHLLFQ